MPFSRILLAISYTLTFLLAECVGITHFGRPEMDAVYRDAYLQHAQRHRIPTGSPRVISSRATTMQHTPRMVSGSKSSLMLEDADVVLARKIKHMLYTLVWKYVISNIHLLIIAGIALHMLRDYALPEFHVHHHVGIIKRMISTRIDRMRYNSTTDTLYLWYQQADNWLYNHRFVILIVLSALLLASSTIEQPAKARDTERFLSWHDFQKIFHGHVPEALLNPQHPYGREKVLGYDAPAASLLDSVRRAPPASAYEAPVSSATAKMQHQHATVVDDGGDDFVRTFVGADRVFCMNCKQWHCCELLY